MSFNIFNFSYLRLQKKDCDLSGGDFIQFVAYLSNTGNK
ncbi:MAG: hypothetical protein ACI9A7_000778 [Cyclobacteriaceae bacterium]|jgi:hypothetical protein